MEQRGAGLWQRRERRWPGARRGDAEPQQAPAPRRRRARALDQRRARGTSDGGCRVVGEVARLRGQRLQDAPFGGRGRRHFSTAPPASAHLIEVRSAARMLPPPGEHEQHRGLPPARRRRGHQLPRRAGVVGGDDQRRSAAQHGRGELRQHRVDVLQRRALLRQPTRGRATKESTAAGQPASGKSSASASINSATASRSAANRATALSRCCVVDVDAGDPGTRSPKLSREQPGPRLRAPHPCALQPVEQRRSPDAEPVGVEVGGGAVLVGPGRRSAAWRRAAEGRRRGAAGELRAVAGSAARQRNSRASAPRPGKSAEHEARPAAEAAGRSGRRRQRGRRLGSAWSTSDVQARSAAAAASVAATTDSSASRRSGERSAAVTGRGAASGSAPASRASRDGRRPGRACRARAGTPSAGSRPAASGGWSAR